MIEGTTPAIVFDSPNLSTPALSDGQVVQYTADRAGRGWVSQMFVRRWDVVVPSTSDKYSLVAVQNSPIDVTLAGDYRSSGLNSPSGFFAMRRFRLFLGQCNFVPLSYLLLFFIYSPIMHCSEQFFIYIKDLYENELVY